MPFINSKISTSLTKAQETEIKTRLGRAIQTIPGKSESWLMVGFEPDYKLYFRGSNAEPILWSRSAFTAVRTHLPFLN